jgi:Zn-dependent peptidase ImmA (M78 family)
MKKRKTLEDEANVFAVCLLIPGHLLREEIDKMGGLDLGNNKQFNALCKIFDVTHSAMALRMGLMGFK